MASAKEQRQFATLGLWLRNRFAARWCKAMRAGLRTRAAVTACAKIHAIFEHGSQKDVAPFPGPHDEREFWQRVEARNRETAARADRLGLPEYYAMEAYVIRGPGAGR